MLLNLLRKVYYNSPFAIRKLIFLIPKEILFGIEYKKHLTRLKKKEVREFNFDIHLSKIFEFEFYKNFYNDIKIDRWTDVPFLTKSELKKLKLNFTNSKSVFEVYTGGVSGKPMKLYQSNNVWYKEVAYIEYLFNFLGLSKGGLKGSFRSGEFGLAFNSDRKYYFNPLHKEINFNPFNLSKDSIQEYIYLLNKYSPEIWYGYPSFFKKFSSLIEYSNLELKSFPKAILFISESFEESDKKFVEDRLGVPVRSYYGQTERIVFAIPNDKNDGYEILQDYGYFELVDEKGCQIKENNVVGEIIATSYDNYAFPLVRFKTGDYTYYKDYEKKEIGLITGKWTDMGFTGYNGEEVSMTSLNFHVKEFENIVNIQYIQNKIGEVEVIVDTLENYDSGIIINLLNKRAGENLTFKISNETQFKRMNRGKLPLIIKNI